MIGVKTKIKKPTIFFYFAPLPRGSVSKLVLNVWLICQQLFFAREFCKKKNNCHRNMTTASRLKKDFFFTITGPDSQLQESESLVRKKQIFFTFIIHVRYKNNVV